MPSSVMVTVTCGEPGCGHAVTIEPDSYEWDEWHPSSHGLAAQLRRGLWFVESSTTMPEGWTWGGDPDEHGYIRCPAHTKRLAALGRKEGA